MLKVFASQVFKVFYVHETTQLSKDIPREMNDAAMDLSVKANFFAINSIRKARRTAGRQAVFSTIHTVCAVQLYDWCRSNNMTPYTDGNSGYNMCSLTHGGKAIRRALLQWTY